MHLNVLVPKLTLKSAKELANLHDTWGSGPLLCMAGYLSLCELFFIMSKFYFDRVNPLEPSFLVLDNNDIE